MSWAVLFRAREYLKGSLWFSPLIGAVLGPLLAVLTWQADTSVTVPAALRYAPTTASTVLTTIVGATVGLTGFVNGSVNEATRDGGGTTKTPRV